MQDSGFQVWPTTHFQFEQVGDLEIFYREAGPRDAPTILLLHGFPSSSHMYRNLITTLADSYHVITLDLPGFGLSSRPGRASFDYTFETFGDTICTLVDQLGIDRYAIYIKDYRAPTGFRMAMRHPHPNVTAYG